MVTVSVVVCFVFFRAYLESEVAISEELVQKYSNSALGHVNSTIKELRRLFLVDDLVDSLKVSLFYLSFIYIYISERLAT